MAIPAACQAIADEITDMESARADLQEQVQQAATDEKAFLARQIKSLTKRIAVAQNLLNDCIEDHSQDPPQPPPPAPLVSTLTGSVTLTTSNPKAQGPFTSAIQIGVIFDGPRSFLAVTSFPDIAATFETDFGPNTTTISTSGGGAGSLSAGEIHLIITLHFDQSIDLPFFEEGSDLPLVLSNDAPGSPVDTSGATILGGAGTFR